MEDIFSTKERVSILKEVILKKGSISVNNIAKQLNLSKGLISKYFGILEKQHILKKTNGKYVVIDSQIVKGIKILLNMMSVNTSVFKKYSFVKSSGLYGSCAKGENTEESDIDLWIKIDETSEDKLASFLSDTKKKINNIKILILTENKINKLKKDDELFYYSLIFGSIVLYGDENALQL